MKPNISYMTDAGLGLVDMIVGEAMRLTTIRTNAMEMKIHANLRFVMGMSLRASTAAVS